MTLHGVASRVPAMAKNSSNPGAAALPRSFALAAQMIEAPRLAPEPALFLVATPIGNLRDITLRALETLAAADVIACEDSRVTGKLTAHYAIRTPLTPYHEHNAAAARPKLLARLAAGECIALVSDAGTPLVSDPGFKLAREAAAAGFPVIAVPGASAVLAALSVSALPSDRFFFEGFLPPKSSARQKRIAALAHIPGTLILFESGPRLAAALADLAAAFGERSAAICRELTKLHEEVRRASLSSLAQHYAGAAETRGEFVVVIAPPEQQQESAEDVDTLLRGALARVSVKDAVGEVASATGLSRREIYQRALTLSKQASDAAPR
jgi:16S rRNA (cytidine1402-2'-O)-methyltransferase